MAIGHEIEIRKIHDDDVQPTCATEPSTAISVPRHFDTLQRDRLTRYHARRLSDLGYQVELKQKEAAA